MLAGFAIGVVAIAVVHPVGAAHADDPMLDMRFFQNPRFTAANSAITLTFFAMFGSMFLMTQYWQFVHGYSPLGAGVRMIPYALTMMVVAPLSARVVERARHQAGRHDRPARHRRRRCSSLSFITRDDAVPAGDHRCSA